MFGTIIESMFKINADILAYMDTFKLSKEVWQRLEFQIRFAWKAFQSELEQSLSSPKCDKAALALVYENLGVTLYFFGLMLRFLLCCLPQLYILELPSALVRKQRCYYFDGGEAERGSWCQVSFPASAVSAVAAFLCTRKHQQTFPQTNQKVRTRFRLTWKSLF